MPQTQFEKCRRDFDKLTAPVNNDPLAQTTVADLHSAALFELDLHGEGEQDPPLTPAQVAQLRRFTAKWAPKEAASAKADRPAAKPFRRQWDNEGHYRSSLDPGGLYTADGAMIGRVRCGCEDYPCCGH